LLARRYENKGNASLNRTTRHFQIMISPSLSLKLPQDRSVNTGLMRVNAWLTVNLLLTKGRPMPEANTTRAFRREYRLFLLRESTNRGQDTRCWPRRLYLRRVRGTLSANHRKKEGQANNARGTFTAARQRPNGGVVKDLGGIQWCLRGLVPRCRISPTSSVNAR
jgi:hypothetical protein